MITINGNTIEQFKKFNFLGITLEQSVTWDVRITKLSMKLRRVSGDLHKIKLSFPQQMAYNL